MVAATCCAREVGRSKGLVNINHKENNHRPPNVAEDCWRRCQATARAAATATSASKANINGKLVLGRVRAGAATQAVELPAPALPTRRQATDLDGDGGQSGMHRCGIMQLMLVSMMVSSRSEKR